MPITWKNVDAPDLSSSAEIFQQGAETLQNAITGLGQQATQAANSRVSKLTDRLVNDIRSTDNLEQFNDPNFRSQFSEESLASQFGQDNVDLNRINAALGAQENRIQEDILQDNSFNRSIENEQQRPFLDKYTAGISSANSVSEIDRRIKEASQDQNISPTTLAAITDNAIQAKRNIFNFNKGRTEFRQSQDTKRFLDSASQGIRSTEIELLKIKDPAERDIARAKARQDFVAKAGIAGVSNPGEVFDRSFTELTAAKTDQQRSLISQADSDFVTIETDIQEGIDTVTQRFIAKNPGLDQFVAMSPLTAEQNTISLDIVNQFAQGDAQQANDFLSFINQEVVDAGISEFGAGPELIRKVLIKANDEESDSTFELDGLEDGDVRNKIKGIIAGLVAKDSSGRAASTLNKKLSRLNKRLSDARANRQAVLDGINRSNLSGRFNIDDKTSKAAKSLSLGKGDLAILDKSIREELKFTPNISSRGNSVPVPPEFNSNPELQLRASTIVNSNLSNQEKKAQLNLLKSRFKIN